MPNVMILREAIAEEQRKAWNGARLRWHLTRDLAGADIWWRRNKYRVLALIDERIFFWNQESKDKEKLA